jgi:hypothetical protein
MNWTAGFLAMLLLWLPCIAILVWMHQSNKRIDREYKEKLAEIEKRFGVKL